MEHQEEPTPAPEFGDITPKDDKYLPELRELRELKHQLNYASKAIPADERIKMQARAIALQRKLVQLAEVAVDRNKRLADGKPFTSKQWKKQKNKSKQARLNRKKNR